MKTQERAQELFPAGQAEVLSTLGPPTSVISDPTGNLDLSDWYRKALIEARQDVWTRYCTLKKQRVYWANTLLFWKGQYKENGVMRRVEIGIAFNEENRVVAVMTADWHPPNYLERFATGPNPG